MVQWLGAVGGIADASQGCVFMPVWSCLCTLWFPPTVQRHACVRSIETIPRSCENSLYITASHPVTPRVRIQPPINFVCLQLLWRVSNRMTWRSSLNVIICCIEDTHVVNWKMWHLSKLGWKKWKMLHGRIESWHCHVLEIVQLFILM